MINDDKRVLEHFNHLLDITRDKEKITVNRQSIKYLVNKLEKYFTQTEQLQELTDEIYQHLEDKESLEQQNKRYREIIKEIKNEAEWMIKLSDSGKKFESILNRCEEALECEDETK